jgi:Glyoxalase-like domain
MMYTRLQVVFDAAEPAKLAEFWAFALGYVPQPPPQGFASWADFGRSIGMPEEQFGDQAALIDPDGAGPRIYFQRVPEPKTAKNRVHLDVRVAGPDVQGEQRELRIEQQVTRLIDAGASIAWRNDDVRGKSVVMRDPEGNEFCVA